MRHPEKMADVGIPSATGPDGLIWPPRSASEPISGNEFAFCWDDSLSNTSALAPGLAELIEAFTQQILDGEPISIDQVADEYPEWSREIRSLLPTMQELARIGLDSVDAGVVPTKDAADSKRRRVFGEFQIVRELGRGGMGIVYEAEQVALSRRVALKVLPLAAAIDQRALHRFQLEAQVAGWLQHPRIVPVYAVGVVAEIPFYAMQLIEGGSLADLISELREHVDRVPTTDTPADSSLSTLATSLLSGQFAPARDASDGKLSGPTTGGSIGTRAYFRTVARLGMQAAEALGYAHERGVVHRDIKPANLLLDHRSDLWVADFGMANVQGDAGLTLTGDLPGTLRYMSPEQALGKRALVDRRTDIYSLGATLYELLTLQAAVDGSDRQGIFRRIVEEEPIPIRRLNPAVPVDLATILAKAMSKDPSNRYETAQHLAEDLGRLLNDRPIAARPVGALARSWRWCRRKPLQAGLAAMLALALTVGFAGITWSLQEAVRQKELLLKAEKEARRQAAKTDAINRFLIQGLLVQAEPSKSPVAHQVTLLEVLDRASATVSASFAEQPELEATIRLTISRIYHGLGEYSKSEAHDREALERLGQLPGDNPERLEAMTELGHMLSHLGRWDEAEPFLREAAQETRRVLGACNGITLRSAEHLADFHRAKGRLDEAEALYRLCLADAQRAPEPDQEVIYSALFNIGDVLFRSGKNTEAEALYRRLLVDYRHRKGERHPDILSAINNLGTVLENQKKYGEAEGLFRECLKSGREVRGPRHPETVTVLYNLGHVLCDQGRHNEAEPLFRESVESRRLVLGREHPSTLYAIGGLASLLMARDQFEEAEALLRPCLESQRRVLGTNHPDTLRSAKCLDDLRLLKGRRKPAPARPSAVARR